MSGEEGYKVTRLDGSDAGDVEPPEYIEFDDEELPDWIRPTKEQKKAWEREQRQAALADIYREPEPEAISGLDIRKRNVRSLEEALREAQDAVIKAQDAVIKAQDDLCDSHHIVPSEASRSNPL